MAIDFIKVLKVIEERRLEVFSTTQLTTLLGVSSSHIQNYLETLANNGLIKRIEKGRYCRVYLDDKFVLGSHMVKGGVVSHQSALGYHGIDDDIPGQVYISSSLQKNPKTVFGNKIRFIKIRPHKDFGAVLVKSLNGAFRVTDTEKTILDCLDLPKYTLSYDRLLKKLPAVPVDQEKLLDYSLKMNNISVLKRLAFLFDQFLPQQYPFFLGEAEKHLNLKYTLLDPAGPKAGQFNSKWRIRNNMNLTYPNK